MKINLAKIGTNINGFRIPVNAMYGKLDKGTIFDRKCCTGNSYVYVTDIKSAGKHAFFKVWFMFEGLKPYPVSVNACTKIGSAFRDFAQTIDYETLKVYLPKVQEKKWEIDRHDLPVMRLTKQPSFKMPASRHERKDAEWKDPKLVTDYYVTNNCRIGKQVYTEEGYWSRYKK